MLSTPKEMCQLYMKSPDEFKVAIPVDHSLLLSHLESFLSTDPHAIQALNFYITTYQLDASTAIVHYRHGIILKKLMSNVTNPRTQLLSIHSIVTLNSALFMCKEAAIMVLSNGFLTTVFTELQSSKVTPRHTVKLCGILCSTMPYDESRALLQRPDVIAGLLQTMVIVQMVQVITSVSQVIRDMLVQWKQDAQLVLLYSGAMSIFTDILRQNTMSIQARDGILILLAVLVCESDKTIKEWFLNGLNGLDMLCSLVTPRLKISCDSIDHAKPTILFEKSIVSLMAYVRRDAGFKELMAHPSNLPLCQFVYQCYSSNNPVTNSVSRALLPYLPHSMWKIALEENTLDAIGCRVDCVICMESSMDGMRILPCMHVFHKECISQWLTVKTEPFVPCCPTCKHSIFVIE
jgi:hypothetical protein